MIPERFVTEYPDRCRRLLDMLEPQARQHDLVGSFGLLVASAAFTIPFARISEARHPLGRPERALPRAIKKLKNVSFLDAPFWSSGERPFFRYAKIVNDPEHAGNWRDAADTHPIKSAETKDANTVLRIVRNALAHGNVVYLDEDGYESPGGRLRYLAFLSRHENEDERSYRVAIFGEEDFLTFLKGWIARLQAFPPESRLVFAEAAE